MNIIADANYVLNLSGEILNGCIQLNETASNIKEECDNLGLSLKDSSYQKVYTSLEIATEGYDLVESNIISLCEAMIEFAELIRAGKEHL